MKKFCSKEDVNNLISDLKNEIKSLNEKIENIEKNVIWKNHLVLLENIRHDNWRRMAQTDQGSIEYEIQKQGWHREVKLGYVIRTEVIEG